MGDNLLVNQLRQGNQLAFTALYKMYANQAFMLSFKYLCNKALAEDAVQNLFMKIWLKRGEID
ncbi:MAG: RNA polymerase subunit sigma-70, partial [Muribaculaceae bacterium]